MRNTTEKGQGLVEYALILVLVAFVVVAILVVLGPQIANTFSRVTSGLEVIGSFGAGGTNPFATVFGSENFHSEHAIESYCHNKPDNTPFKLYRSGSNYRAGGSGTTAPNGYTLVSNGTCD